MRPAFVAPGRRCGYTPGMKRLDDALKLAALATLMALSAACNGPETPVPDDQLETESSGQA